ncbi:hypothetical protein VP277E431_P0098 [Vibrio phage 277E43-1]|nr:hypothetical protein VP277E431_P0098 [Vibrio phage 277E43-1]
MIMNNTENRVMRCIVDQIGCSMSDLERNTSLEVNLGFDNLDFVELLMALEEEFDSTWNDEYYHKNCRTVGELTHWVKSLVVPLQTVPENNVDAIETQSDDIVPNSEKNAHTAHTEAPLTMFQQMQKVCDENNVNIEFTCKGEVYVQAEDDFTYKIKDEKQLTQLLDAVKLLASFKEE